MQDYQFDRRVAGAFARFAGGFWRGPTAATAWALTLGLALCLSLSTAVTVGLNHWHRWFFDALEQRDAATATTAVLVVLGIIAAMSAIGVGIVLTRETLQVRWRAFLVERLTGLWIDKNRFYHLSATHTEPDNPEYRISDDSRWATEPLTDLAIGLFSAVIGAAAFISILWSVGGSTTLPIAGMRVTIPAYMVLLALAYGAIASGLMLWIGRRLVDCVARKNAAEGEFRFALMRVRENAESVALIGGGGAERQSLGALYGNVVARWLAIVRQHGRLTWVMNASGPMIPIIPLLFAAPKYFAGEFSLGEVVQLAAAFVQVQLAISWIVDNYNRIAEWFASARRVMDIVEACDGLDGRVAALGHGGARIALATSTDGRVHVDGVVVTDTAGRTLVAADGLSLPPGARVEIHGNTSAGKSSLVRALSGLWPWGRGRIALPADARLMVVPQRPYLPTGTLRHALVYPSQRRPRRGCGSPGRARCHGAGASRRPSRSGREVGPGARQR